MSMQSATEGASAAIRPCAHLWLKEGLPDLDETEVGLWLRLSDGRVLAFRLPRRLRDQASLVEQLARAFADDPRGQRLEVELAGQCILPAYVAPAVPIPALSWGDPSQVAARDFGLMLDQEVLRLLASLNRHRVWDSLRNYNRLAALPPTLRERRLQALWRFPLLVAPILLTAHHRLRLEGGQRHAWREHNDAVLDAIDRGRDLAGALARCYGISRGLVRSPICRTMWGSTALSHRRLLRLLDGMPPNRRPTSPAEFEPAIPLFITVNQLAGDNADLRRVGRRAFARGLDALCVPLHARFAPLGPAFADCGDFIRAALAVARADTRDATRRRLGDRALQLGWIETLGFRSLLAASARWHRMLHRMPQRAPDQRSLASVLGEFQSRDGRATELVTEADLVCEGERMRHCIATYWPECRDQGLRVFSLWHLGERATADFGFHREERYFSIHDVRGIANAEPSPAMRALVRAVAAALNAPGLAAVRAALADSLSQACSMRGDDARPPAWIDPQSERELARVLEAMFGPAPECGILLRAPIAGYAHYTDSEQGEPIRPGDELQLVREPDNPSDTGAVALHWRGRKIGYVPRGANQAIVRRLEAGQALRCRLTRIDSEEPPWRRVMFEIRG